MTIRIPFMEIVVVCHCQSAEIDQNSSPPSDRGASNDAMSRSQRLTFLRLFDPPTSMMGGFTIIRSLYKKVGLPWIVQHTDRSLLPTLRHACLPVLHRFCYRPCHGGVSRSHRGEEGLRECSCALDFFPDRPQLTSIHVDSSRPPHHL